MAVAVASDAFLAVARAVLASCEPPASRSTRARQVTVSSSPCLSEGQLALQPLPSADTDDPAGPLTAGAPTRVRPAGRASDTDTSLASVSALVCVTLTV